MRNLAAWILFAIVLSGEAYASNRNPRVESNLSAGEHVVVVNDVRLWYFVAGSGPLIVVQCPGWGIGSEYLRNGLAPLLSHFTMVFYDTRGSGHSSRPADASTITVSQMADDLEALRQHWGLSAMTLFGHSWGGGIALAYSMRYPMRVEKLIVVGSSIPGFDYSQMSQEFHRQWVEAKSDPRFAEAMAALEADPAVHDDEQYRTELLREWPWMFFNPTEAMPRFLKTAPGLASAWTWNAWHANFARDQSVLRPKLNLGSVSARTLILNGREDRVCPVGGAEYLHSGIQASKLRVFERSGHLPWIEVPQEFFGEVLKFLKGEGAADS
jgi:proline iminopeptidase